MEHRRGVRRGGRQLLATPPIVDDILGRLRVPDAEVGEGDPLAARQELEVELLAGEVVVAVDRLEPGLGGPRRPLGGLDLGPAVALVGREGGGHVPVVGHESVHQGDGVLHRQLRPRPDGEVSRVGGIADDHVPVPPPPLGRHLGKADPLAVVADQFSASEVIAEHLLGERLGGWIGLSGSEGAVRLEAGRLPRRFRHLDDEGGEAFGVGVAVCLHHAVGGALEQEREDAEVVLRPEPCVAGRTRHHVGDETVGQRPASGRVHAIGHDHQVGIEGRRVGDVLGEPDFGAELPDAVGEDLQEAEPREGGEPVARRASDLSVLPDLQVRPVAELRFDPLERDRVGIGDVAQCLIGEDDPEPVSGVVRVALEDCDFDIGQCLAGEDGGEEAGRPTADADDAAHGQMLGP